MRKCCAGSHFPVNSVLSLRAVGGVGCPRGLCAAPLFIIGDLVFAALFVLWIGSAAGEKRVGVSFADAALLVDFLHVH